MKFNPKSLTILFLLIAILSACGGTQPEEQLTTDDAVLTLAVGTMVAGFFGTQTAMVTPTPPNTNTPPPTNTFLPTPTPYNTLPPPATWTPTFIFYTFTPVPVLLTPSVTGTLPTATVNAGSLAHGCNNLAFVRDVNYPPGTEVAPRENFVKTWKVENTGTCEWKGHYTLSIVKDDFFDSSWNPLGRVVQPGQWAELSVIVDAPKTAGTYTSYWRFTDGANAFGATLGLTVVVKE
ncbi:MAG: hypothetical protein DPW18_09595 [Chloroflexi bacterium]|nr:hypothetical protein [Chloroflexota bacterium]MDL1941779.1 hypothetical protein [Chloroflexi bacterium CFX2]